MKVSKGGRLCLQSTQKKGCPAHITIREFVLYPDYKIVPSIDMSSSKLRSLRQSSLQDLRKDLDSGAGVKTISKFMFAFQLKKLTMKYIPLKARCLWLREFTQC